MKYLSLFGVIWAFVWASFDVYGAVVNIGTPWAAFFTAMALIMAVLFALNLLNLVRFW